MIEASFARPLLRFRALGIPVQVELTFLLTTLLLAGNRRSSIASFALWLAVVFVSILLHEIGHALAGRRFGLTPAIRLYGWGGLTSFSDGPAPGPARRIVIAVAGPAVGIAVGAVCYLVAIRLPAHALFARGLLDDFIWASGVWGAANLLPILPLDGGLALEAALAVGGGSGPPETKVGSGRGAQHARLVSAVIGLGAGAIGVALGVTVAGLLAAWLGVDNARRFVLARRDERDEALRARLAPALEAAIEASDGALLVSTASAAIAEARTDVTRTWLAEHIAIGHALSGSFADAIAALAAAPDALPASVAAEAFVVALAVGRRKRDLAAAIGADPEVWANAVSPATGDGAWEAASALLRGPRDVEVDALGFAWAREAAEILGRDADAASLGEGLLARAPDPDLAFAVACAWARAGETDRAAAHAARAAALGFRDWERVDEAGEAAARAFARVER